MGKWKPGLQFDSVKGERKDGGGNLPRISPQRVIASLDYSQKGWTIRPELIWVADSKGASVDPVTEGHQLINLRIAKTFDATKLMGGISDGGALAGEFFANLSNLTDELAYSASTISTVRNYTPLQGRSALVGIKILF
jgi:iron complex outermembrane receptor protein